MAHVGAMSSRLSHTDSKTGPTHEAATAGESSSGPSIAGVGTTDAEPVQWASLTTAEPSQWAGATRVMAIVETYSNLWLRFVPEKRT